MTVIPIVIGAPCTVIKRLIHKLDNLDIRGQVKTIQIIALLRSVRILRRVLEAWGNLLSLKLSVNIGLKNSQMNKIIRKMLKKIKIVFFFLLFFFLYLYQCTKKVPHPKVYIQSFNLLKAFQNLETDGFLTCAITFFERYLMMPGIFSQFYYHHLSPKECITIILVNAVLSSINLKKIEWLLLYVPILNFSVISDSKEFVHSVKVGVKISLQMFHIYIYIYIYIYI